jgi:hypothetical protein
LDVHLFCLSGFPVLGQLVDQKSCDRKLRDFKTIVGLVSFLAEMGCTTASIPLVDGARERHAAPGRMH